MGIERLDDVGRSPFLIEFLNHTLSLSPAKQKQYHRNYHDNRNHSTSYNSARRSFVLITG
jgi:hypothetical protein